MACSHWVTSASIRSTAERQATSSNRCSRDGFVIAMIASSSSRRAARTTAPLGLAGSLRLLLTLTEPLTG